MAAHIIIVVPNYNMQNYLSVALETALNQTVQDFEVLVIDDGSTDDSVSVEKSNPFGISVFLLEVL